MCNASLFSFKNAIPNQNTHKNQLQGEFNAIYSITQVSCPIYCIYCILQKKVCNTATLNILFSWLIFPLSANLQHLHPNTYQILGVNPPLIHGFSNYILYKICENEIAIFFLFNSICLLQYR